MDGPAIGGTYDRLLIDSLRTDHAVLELRGHSQFPQQPDIEDAQDPVDIGPVLELMETEQQKIENSWRGVSFLDAVGNMFGEVGRRAQPRVIGPDVQKGMDDFHRPDPGELSFLAGNVELDRAVDEKIEGCRATTLEFFRTPSRGLEETLVPGQESDDPVLLADIDAGQDDGFGFLRNAHGSVWLSKGLLNKRILIQNWNPPEVM